MLFFALISFLASAAQADGTAEADHRHSISLGAVP